MTRSREPATFQALRIALLTISDRRTPADDDSGNLLAESLGAAGHLLAERALLPDDRYQLRAICSRWIAAPEVEVIITTGGTGLTGRDITPEALGPLLDRPIDGFGELFRQVSLESVGTATIQSRALAGIANATFVFCLPGSPDACQTAWTRILQPQLDRRTQPCNFAQLLPRLRESAPARG